MEKPTPARVALMLVILFGAWTIFGLLSSAHFFFGYEKASDFSDFLRMADNVIVFYWGWALLTPLVILVAHRVAPEGMRRSRDWLVMLAAGVAVMLVHGMIHTTLVTASGIDLHAGGYSLTQYIQRHGGGDLATYAVLVGGYLLFQANRRARARELAAAELAGRLARADLELLRWNLHPHFLFNALNTVSTLVLKGHGEDANRAISLISRYLRAGLAQRADALTPLGEDISMVKRYMEIEALRFGDSLRMEVTTDSSDTMTALMPGSILQPLVENAIAHGGVREPGADPIRIDAAVRGSRLIVSVHNPAAKSKSGAGTEGPATNGDADSARFGLRYVRERLRQFYGDDAAFDLSTSETGTVARVDVPLSRTTEQG
ncbi:MAG TPA: histidine kinase [Gemmatimonadaceae bacterium]|nr:histidine kinase [Gemmatimonadaceae bacterium]